MYKNFPLKRLFIYLLTCLNLSPTLTKPTTLVPKETGQKIILTFSLRDIQHAENNQNDDIYYSG